MLKIENKSINKIFTIIQSKEAKLKSKQVIKNIDNAALTFYTHIPKRKATYDNLYYKYYQKCYFRQDYSFLDYKKKIDVSR